MNRQNEKSFCIMFCAFIMTSSAAGEVTSQAPFVKAYMDRQLHDQGYGCGATIQDTVSGEISSFIPANTPAFNCSLTVVSPPGTRLSLTVTRVHLVTLNLNTCEGNRLKILSDEEEGSTSLLRSFPNGLCGYTKPSQSVLSPGNRVHLLLESHETAVENTFNLSYTAFKTTIDDDCFACDVFGNTDTPFCIDPRLVCDDRQNCPRTTEEIPANCMASSAPPSGSGNIVIIVIVCVLAVVLVVVLIFIILAVMAKRAQSKRNRGSAGPGQSERASQSRRVAAPPGLMVDLDRHQGYADVPELYELAPRPPPPQLLSQPRGPPPSFTVDGEHHGGFQPVTAGRFPGAPPAYSTLPRPREQSLQMAENTNPTSRSRIASTDEEVEPRTP
ncbi:uncharacterized protein LOC119739317 isoform X1 [Patiria miniata]|uniref:CUB domain-containing protein n=1 Tax=Patiria miniata TaxID=46514 RepID=A0A914B2U9_PATMI|nr:uncharacterized protein LOC119739317 isoform X1 [Patiria miniata]